MMTIESAAFRVVEMDEDDVTKLAMHSLAKTYNVADWREIAVAAVREDGRPVKGRRRFLIPEAAISPRPRAMQAGDLEVRP